MRFSLLPRLQHLMLSLLAGEQTGCFRPGRYHPALVGVVVETLRRCPDALIVFASTVSMPRERVVVVSWTVARSGFGRGRVS